MTTLVYRMETVARHPSNSGLGEGAFRGGGVDLYDADRIEGDCTRSMPTPYTEGGEFCQGFNPAIHYFGFTSLAQLKEVFSCPRGCKALSPEFQIGVYRVESDAVIVGRHQCVFDPKKSTRLRTISPLELH